MEEIDGKSKEEGYLYNPPTYIVPLIKRLKLRVGPRFFLTDLAYMTFDTGGVCRDTNETIAEDWNLSVSSIQRILRSLDRDGYISRRKVKGSYPPRREIKVLYKKIEKDAIKLD